MKGKFVGSSLANLLPDDRATIGHMTPEYGFLEPLAFHLLKDNIAQRTYYSLDQMLGACALENSVCHRS